jgi:hypothetical protein
VPPYLTPSIIFYADEEGGMSFKVDGEYVRHDAGRDAVLFRATYDGKRVICAVSREALNDLTGSSHSQADQLIMEYHNNAARIAAVAECKARANWFEADGSILVRTADLA